MINKEIVQMSIKKNGFYISTETSEEARRISTQITNELKVDSTEILPTCSFIIFHIRSLTSSVENLHFKDYSYSEMKSILRDS